MLKTITKEEYICDLCLAESGLEVIAVGKLIPSNEDVCEKHLKAMSKEIRLPKQLGGEMSGYKIGVSNGNKPRFKIIFNEE
jgi:hypothetical protein